MKFICSQEKLLEAINIVQKAVSSKSTLTILTGILVEAGENLKLTANDLEIAIECIVDADIQEQGSIVLNSRIFGEIIRKMPNSDILISMEEKNENEFEGEEDENINLVLIESEGSLFKIKGINPDGFPVLPDIKEDFVFSIKENILRNMIKQTIFAVSADETKGILTGALIEFEKGELHFVCIDGYRVAIKKEMLEGNSTEEFKVVVPGKTLNEILKILKQTDEDVTINKSKNQILFKIGNCKVVSRLLDGEFLNHNNVIPKEFSTKVKLNRDDILLSIERASLIAMDGDKHPIKISITDDLMIIRSIAAVGSMKEELFIEIEGDNIEVAFNPRYFIEALRVVDTEHVYFCFTSEFGPCTIKPLEGDGFLHMILPVMTS